MAVKSRENRKKIVKKTSQGGRVKTSALNKSEKRNYKAYRGQGR